MANGVPSGTEQAAVYLRMLLDRPGDYRTRWEHTPASGIDYAAVGRVLAEPGPGDSRVPAEPGPAERVPAEPGAAGRVTEELAGVARRALEGASLDQETLRRFVDAFEVREPHARRLAALIKGTDTVRAVSGDLLPADEEPPAVPARRDETLSLHEYHLLGPDGLPAEHQTIQVIRSKVDGLYTLPYCFDTDEIVVEVLRGGTLGERVHRVNDTLYAVNIVLDRPLARGHTALVRYHSTFAYRSAPPPEFRRGFIGRADDLTMWVRFDPERLPRRVWQARWDAVDHGRVVERQEVRLDDELSVHCRYRRVARTVVGFYWEF